MGRYAELREEWTGIVEQWSDSGLSGAEFCRRRELSVARFYSWRRRLGTAASSDSGAFVPLTNDAVRRLRRSSDMEITGTRSLGMRIRK